MKNFATAMLLFWLSRFGADRAVRRHSPCCPGGPSDAFNDDPFAGLYALSDDVVLPTRSPSVTLRSATLLFVADDVNDIGALHLRDGFLRHQQSVFRHGRGQPDAAELTGPQQGFRIGELGDEAQGAGLQVHCAVGDDDAALLGKCGAVSQDQFQFACAPFILPSAPCADTSGTRAR